MYCFINWIQTSSGYSPELPEGTAFLLLAEPGEPSAGAKFALFECDLPEGCPELRKVEPVSEGLGELLDSAKAYPPALALTRDEVFSRRYNSRPEFAAALAAFLNSYLASQRTAPYFLAAARVTEPHYKSRGAYYWIVGCRGDTVAWVSRDYFVYHDPVEDFDISRAELKRRFGAGTV